jgi:LmbE family N-acetylglucosaminyl deacetylase
MLEKRTIRTLAGITAASVSLAASTRQTPLLSGANFPTAATTGVRQAVDTTRSKEILEQLRRFRMAATVLDVGAHPDDENTQLMAALSRGRAVRTAYLSITRGDGGQNLLGPDFGYKLGIARTQELLAARRIDGGRQFFTRALDFGFSKDYLETFSVWNKDSILGDVVRVVRGFRPDVIITVFSTQPGGTHGHHTASAVLALDAFTLAADPKAYPEQLSTLKVWQPKRILIGGGRGAAATSGPRMEIGGVDPVLGESFASIATRSRAMHKTQGFGQPGGGGGRGGGAAPTSRMQGFTLLAGEPANADIFEGIDTTWARFPGGAPVERLAGAAMDKFDLANPSQSVTTLLEIRKIVAGLGADPLVVEKKALLDKIILDCAGVTAKTTLASSEVVPGERLVMTSSFRLGSRVPVTLLEIRSPEGTVGNGQPVTESGSVVRWDKVLPANTPLTQPYWLRKEGMAGMFRVDDPSLIGLPENPPAFPITYVFGIGGQQILLADEPVQMIEDTARGMTARQLDVIPAASVGFATDVIVFRPGATKEVDVDVSAHRDNGAGTLALDNPTGWTVVPASRPVSASKAGSVGRYKFTVTAPNTATTATIGAHVTIGDRTWNTSRGAIDYPHIPRQLLQPVANFKAVSVDIATRGETVAYIPGAGDDVPEALDQMGYAVTKIPAKSVTADTLRRFDAVVIGVRSSNINADLGAAMPALTAYAENGGTVIEQYNQSGNLRNTVLGPYPLSIGSERVTDENAPVTFLVPDHPVLNTPNKITASDFAGWVQERGIYFPNSWDSRYTPILGMSDAGEALLNGSLLIAKVGKGYFAYTGLVFFRELPAGVPGAYRLFANLISLGKPPVVVP